MNNKLKKILVNLGIFILTIIIVLAILEIAVRIFTKPVYPILRTDKEVDMPCNGNVLKCFAAWLSEDEWTEGLNDTYTLQGVNYLADYYCIERLTTIIVDNYARFSVGTTTEEWLALDENYEYQPGDEGWY